MKILVIVPAFNEEKNLPIVFNDLRTHFNEADIVVINDGSKDETSRVARQFGATVIDLPYNLGIGGAMQTGFLYALRNGYDMAIQFDGDAQHRADEINKIMSLVANGKADMSIGSRFLEAGAYNQTFSRMAGIKVFASVMSLLTGQKLTDTTSGFRAYGMRTIGLFSDYYPDDYPEVEAILLLHKKGLRVIEVPVEMRQRQWGSSSITALKAVYYMFKVMLAVLIRRIS